ncbi:unnamed protein product [Brassicogethes aeneus]|uniref:SAM domain-containing protein n=1 Tax=Brassicogethes aeneus TaxID=1431903 RepID=A0A9P0AYZ9_BRAAE|nr:unnamed protein product [Brassicogethes aeneus]
MTTNTGSKIFLLIHTMTITECDYVVQAQFYHAFNENLARIDDARLVARRLSMRVHPNLRRNRSKNTLHLLNADLKSLMKRNSSKIKHHLRTVHIVTPNVSLTPPKLVPKIDNDVHVQAVVIPPQITIQNCGIEKKVEHNKVTDITNADFEQLCSDSSPDQTVNWLTTNRFEKYLQTFCSFSGADMLRMSRDDLIQICGHADGIRMYNVLHLRTIAPKLKIYVCREKSSVFNAVFLFSFNNNELVQKLSSVINVPYDKIKDIYIEGPQSIHIRLTNDVLSHVKEETMFLLEVIQDSDSFILLLKRTLP